MKPHATPGTVLIVDDALENLRLLSDMLTAQGYRVRAAKTGLEAIASVNSERPDLILLDIKLPDISGYEVCTALKAGEDTRAVPVIFLSAFNETAEKLRAFAAGGVDYVTKPFIAEEVLVRAGTHLEMSRLRSQLELHTADLQLRNEQLQAEVAERRRTAEELSESLRNLEDSRKATLNLLEDLKKEIEHRKETETRVRETQILLEASIESPQDMIILAIDTQYRYLHFNSVHREVMRKAYGKEVKIGMNMLDCITKSDDRAQSRINCDRALAGECHTTIEEYGDVERRYYETRYNPILTGMNTIMGIAVFAADITERKRAEETLHRYTERLQNLHRIDLAILQAMESLETIVQAALHHVRNLLHCRHSGVKMFDVERNEVCVFTTEADGGVIVHPAKALAGEDYEDMETLWRGQTEVLEHMSDVTPPSAMTRVLKEQGMASSISVPLLSAQRLYGVLSIGWEEIRGITAEETEIAREVAGEITIAIEQAYLLREAKRHSLELDHRVTERTAQLEAANKELEAFSYSVSHDLRAPLRTIDGYTSMLLEDHGPYLDAEGKRICSVIGKSAKNMAKLIDDLLSFSRLGRTEIRLAPVDMAALVDSAFFALTTDVERRRIELRVGPLSGVLGDTSLLRQVWMNLLSNALKFSSRQEQAVIEVGCEEKEDDVIYSIRDNGAGFDMAYADKLFGVFQRLHSAKEFEGTGVGLAIVQRIIHRHGGRVWAEGEPNKGTVFYFALPAACKAA